MTTMNESKMPKKSGAASTTSLAQWTGIPVLRRKPLCCGEESGNEEILDEQDTRALRLHAERIAVLCDETSRKTTTAIIEIGGELSAAQSLLAGKGRDGRFAPWYRCQGFNRSEVYRAIAAHKVFNKCPTVGHFDAKSVYLLSSDSCPEEATVEAMRLAEDGNYIDHNRAKEIVAKYIPKKPTDRKRLPGKPEEQNPSENPTNGKQLPQQSRSEAPEGEIAAGSGGDTTQGRNKTESDAEGDTGVICHGVVEPAPQSVEDGLAALDALVLVLESLGIDDECQDALDNIRVALERYA